MRPSSPPNLMIRATAGDDGMAVVEVEALSADGGLADFGVCAGDEISRGHVNSLHNTPYTT